MELSHSEYAVQTRSSVLQNILSGLRRVLVSDPGLIAQLLGSIVIIGGGILLNLNTVQWVLTLLATLLFLAAGIFRGAALLQVKRDPSLSRFHVQRIKCMGNALVTITAGLSLFTYLMIFVPRIIAYF